MENNRIESIKIEAYKEFLIRLSMTPKGECVDIVATPGFNNEIKTNNTNYENAIKRNKRSRN